MNSSGYDPAAASRRNWFARLAASFVLCAGLLAGAASDAGEPPKAARAGTVLDLTGHPIDPFRARDHAALVFIFISTDCPISNRYAPEVRRLQSKYASRRIFFALVHADPTVSGAAVRKHAEEFQLSGEILRDPAHVLVKKCRARVTPEAAVFTPDGQLAYRGRIDDRYVELGKARPEARTHDLADALEAILAGKAIAARETRAIGCSIPSAK